MNLSRWTLLLAVAALAFVSSLRAEDAPKHAAVTPAPRDAGWVKRHEGFVDEIKKKDKVDLLFIGDSITDGWRNKDIKPVWDKFYGSRNAVNLGIGGDQTQHVLWRLENGEISGISPKLAVLMIGTNNSGRNTSQEIADGVAAIVAKLRKDLPETKVLVLGIFPRGEDNNNKQRQVNQGANEIIKKLADDKNVFYLDIGPKFTEPDGKLSREIMPDLLHLNEKSYTIWAEAIEPTVAKLMGEKKE